MGKKMGERYQMIGDDAMDERKKVEGKTATKKLSSS